jgi:aspartate-semialdehyde dehydrogenase
VRELVQQMGFVHESARTMLEDPACAILEVDRAVTSALRDWSFPSQQFGFPLAGSLLAWIDKDLGDGQSREEWKTRAEGNKILGRETNPIPMDGICVRIGAMRCHSQALTVKLKRDLPLDEIEHLLAGANDWVRVVPNGREATLRDLTPAKVSGTMEVPIGRLRKPALGKEGSYLTAFTVGDQLLWGAAEPLRRMLRVLLQE